MQKCGKLLGEDVVLVLSNSRRGASEENRVSVISSPLPKPQCKEPLGLRAAAPVRIVRAGVV